MIIEVDNLILGGGISGISASFHIGHNKCLILEQNNYSFGILQSETTNDFTWDQGPHVSFTKHDYVKQLFAKNIDNNYEEHVVSPSSYYRGLWIDHPIQSNLYQLPVELKDRCIESFLLERDKDNFKKPVIRNYREWLNFSLGEEITNEFVTAYTKKYWTVDPSELTTDWIGPRVYAPNIKDFLDGAKNKISKSTHYISKIRYPTQGGYQSFVEPLANNAILRLGHKVIKVDLKDKVVECENGNKFKYSKLISTIPLPIFIRLIQDFDKEAKIASEKLRCSELLLVNVEVPHKVLRKEHWLYVYDEDMLSTRITIMDNLAKSNAPKDQSAVQVEVYSSVDKPLNISDSAIAEKVVDELFSMGIISKKYMTSDINWHTRKLKFANVIFDHNRRDALDLIFSNLEPYGLIREKNDLDALTDWTKFKRTARGDLCLLGRFGEWKYYWSDDCVMAGKTLFET